MEGNDDAGYLTPRGGLTFFVGTPPGACSLLRGGGRLISVLPHHHRSNDLIRPTPHGPGSGPSAWPVRPAAGRSRRITPLLVSTWIKSSSTRIISRSLLLELLEAGRGHRFVGVPGLDFMMVGRQRFRGFGIGGSFHANQLAVRIALHVKHWASLRNGPASCCQQHRPTAGEYAVC